MYGWFFGSFRRSGGLLEARFGLQSLAKGNRFCPTKYQPWLLAKSPSYGAFWFLKFDARILILSLEWSMGHSENSTFWEILVYDVLKPKLIPLVWSMMSHKNVAKPIVF